jgi:hypothetical protein
MASQGYLHSENSAANFFIHRAGDGKSNTNINARIRIGSINNSTDFNGVN